MYNLFRTLPRQVYLVTFLNIGRVVNNSVLPTPKSRLRFKITGCVQNKIDGTYWFDLEKGDCGCHLCTNYPCYIL